jgi:DNA-binding HxlR family transcriptional regulator
MDDNGYARYCPTAMACALLEPRWTILILCELYSGAARFNEIHSGLPGISPSLLSRRLKEMAQNGLIDWTEGRDGRALYLPTPMADDLRPVIDALGEWAHRNVDPEIGLQKIDERPLMWNIRRKIDVSALPRRRATVQFILTDGDEAPRNYWLLIRPNAETDLCMVDPKHEVDLFITAELRALTRAWMGHSTFGCEIEAGRIQLIGDAAMARSLGRWMVRSSFAGDTCRVTAE